MSIVTMIVIMTMLVRQGNGFVVVMMVVIGVFVGMTTGTVMRVPVVYMRMRTVVTRMAMIDGGFILGLAGGIKQHSIFRAGFAKDWNPYRRCLTQSSQCGAQIGAIPNR